MIPPALATAEVPEVLPSPPLSASARGRCSPCSGTGTMLLGHCFAGVSHCSASAALAHTELNAFNLSTPLKLLQLTSPMLAVFAERKRVNSCCNISEPDIPFCCCWFFPQPERKGELQCLLSPLKENPPFGY